MLLTSRLQQGGLPIPSWEAALAAVKVQVQVLPLVMSAHAMVWDKAQPGIKEPAASTNGLHCAPHKV
jgi:hypothetical protein